MLDVELVNENTISYWEKVLNDIIDFLPEFLFGIVVFLLGIVLVKLILKVLTKALERSKIEATVHGFIKSMVKWTLYALVVVIALSSIGVELSSIVAVIGATGLAVGLGIQSSLANVAGGFTILFSKPFKKGDYIEANGIQGTVEEITMVNTKLLTPDNKAIHIPNGVLAASTVTNFTEEKLRRLDLTFSISYENDFEKAKSIINRIIDKNDLAFKNPVPFVRVGEHAKSSINIMVRIWVNSEDYWTLNFDMLENVKKEFDKEGISIPYNHIDVHLDDKDNKSAV